MLANIRLIEATEPKFPCIATWNNETSIVNGLIKGFGAKYFDVVITEPTYYSNQLVFGSTYLNTSDKENTLILIDDEELVSFITRTYGNRPKHLERVIAISYSLRDIIVIPIDILKEYVANTNVNKLIVLSFSTNTIEVKFVNDDIESLTELEAKIDVALKDEAAESLLDWIINKREKNKEKLIADIRNKLTPLYNLVSILRNKDVVELHYKDVRIGNVVEAEINEALKSINYLKNLYE